MSSTVGDRLETGALKATAADVEVRTVGHPVRKVVVMNTTSSAKLEWNDQMGDGEGIKTVAAGTRTNVTTGGITPLAGANPGFQIGTQADINDAADEDLIWEATE